MWIPYIFIWKLKFTNQSKLKIQQFLVEYPYLCRSFHSFKVLTEQTRPALSSCRLSISFKSWLMYAQGKLCPLHPHVVYTSPIPCGSYLLFHIWSQGAESVINIVSDDSSGLTKFV